MGPKTDTSAKVDFGLPKWYQNRSKIEPKGIQNLCKIASKIDAKINAEKVSENEAKMNQNWCRNGAKTDIKYILFEKWWFCENLAFTRGSEGPKIDKKSIRKRCKNTTRKSYAKMIKNDAQMESKWIQNRPKGLSKVDAKIDAKIDAKRHPQKAICRTPQDPPPRTFQVDFGWPKWHQNGSKMERNRFQNLCKIISKIDAKINAEKVSENETKMNQNWCGNCTKTDTKFVLFEKWWFCEHLVFILIKARLSRFRGSKNR